VKNKNDWRFVIDTTKDALRDAPTYEGTVAPERLTPQSGTNR
jgi:hypothetical protein